MTNNYECHIDGCEYDDGDSLAALRSHVAGSKDEAHQQARRNQAWNDWYADETPTTEGGDDPAEEGETEGSTDPPDDVPEVDPTESPDDGRDDTGQDTPPDGGPDPTEEYADQWGSDDDPADEGDEGGTDPTGDGDSGGSTPTGDGDSDVGAAAALVAGSALVGLVVLLTRSKDEDEPIEVASEVEDVDPTNDPDETGNLPTVSEGGSW